MVTRAHLVHEHDPPGPRADEHARVGVDVHGQRLRVVLHRPAAVEVHQRADEQRLARLQGAAWQTLSMNVFEL